MLKNKLSPEAKLLLSCVKTSIDTSVLEQNVKLLPPSFNMIGWKYLLEHFLYHGVLNLFYYNISKLNKSSVCGEIISIAKSCYRATLERNKQLWKEFLFIQDVLQKSGNKVIPIKGIILNKILYPDSGLRPMGDIDLLIQEKDLVAAADRLLQLGYRKFFKNIPQSYWKKYHCHLGFYDPTKNIILELHWKLAPPRPNELPIEEIWQRGLSQLFDSVEVLTLSLEDTLLSLILHITKNISTLQRLRFINLCDINELITRYKEILDWEYIVNKTRTWRLKGSFFYVYLVTKNYLDTPWPEEIITELQTKIAKKIVLNFFASKLRRFSRFQAVLLMSATLDTTKDFFALALQRIFMLGHKFGFLLSSILRHDK